MRTKQFRYTTGAVLAATVAMTVASGPTALAGPAGIIPEQSAADSNLSASISSDIALRPQALADMAQHAVDAGVAGAAGALAGRAVGFRKKSSSTGAAIDSGQGGNDTQFDAPTS